MVFFGLVDESKNETGKCMNRTEKRKKYKQQESGST